MKVSNIAPFGVRMPPDLKRRLETSAKENSRSLNAEVVYWLQKAMDEKDASDLCAISRQMPMHIKDDHAYNFTGGNSLSSSVLEQLKMLVEEIEGSLQKNEGE